MISSPQPSQRAQRNLTPLQFLCQALYELEFGNPSGTKPKRSQRTSTAPTRTRIPAQNLQPSTRRGCKITSARWPRSSHSVYAGQRLSYLSWRTRASVAKRILIEVVQNSEEEEDNSFPSHRIRSSSPTKERIALVEIS